MNDISGYSYHNANADPSHAYLLPPVLATLGAPSKAVRVFDLGCGDGAIAEMLHMRGWSVTGVDPSETGITHAQANRPGPEFHQASAYDDLAARFGRFPFVVSLEVVEHVYAPRDYARTLFDLVAPGGQAIVSTPYHGYLKNLAIAAAGKMDRHFTALWDHGHIKFWSMDTLTTLLTEAGFVDIRFERLGRIPVLAKSMVAIARRPG